MANKKKYIIFFSFIILTVSILIIYKLLFYTFPFLDSGKRNLTEKTIDFLMFGWHFTKASIYKDYVGNRNKANIEFGKAGWYRKSYLIKKFNTNKEDLISVLELYKSLNINSILEKLYVSLMREKSDDISFLREAGEKLVVCENWEMAIMAFSKVIDSNSNDHFSLYYLGLSHLHLKILSKANEYFERAIEQKTDFADAYYRLGLIAEKEKKWKKAQSYYEKTLNILPNHLDSLKALKKINKKLK